MNAIQFDRLPQVRDLTLRQAQLGAREGHASRIIFHALTDAGVDWREVPLGFVKSLVTDFVRTTRQHESGHRFIGL